MGYLLKHFRMDCWPLVDEITRNCCNAVNVNSYKDIYVRGMMGVWN